MRILKYFFVILIFYTFFLFYSKYSISYKKTVSLGGFSVGFDSSYVSSGVSYNNKSLTIGTLTYIDNGKFAALGHRNGSNFGDVVLINIVGSVKNSIDNIGYVIDDGFYNNVIGNVDFDSDIGVYGKYFFDATESIDVGMPKDVRIGEAYIKTNVGSGKSEYYNINIYFVEYFSNKSNIYFEITDKNLLSITGGVVKGMSGSPIIQNNKIIGAVNSANEHDNTKGYGIFITSMLEH